MHVLLRTPDRDQSCGQFLCGDLDSSEELHQLPMPSMNSEVILFVMTEANTAGLNNAAHQAERKRHFGCAISGPRCHMDKTVFLGLWRNGSRILGVALYIVSVKIYFIRIKIASALEGISPTNCNPLPFH